MSYFPSDFLEQLRSASDIVFLITEDTTLKGQGDRFMGLCPFPEHDEKTASFSVSQSKQLYHCFGCQNSGNIFTYLQKQRGMNFVESVEYLARKTGIALPKQRDYKSAQWDQSFFQLSEKIGFFYKQQLTQLATSHPAHSYLKKRAYTKETIESFCLGYAPKGNVLLNFLKTAQEKKLALDLGLLNRSADGELYDNFRHRLIFPIFSIRKQVIGFGARAFGDSLPKYINSKESKIFHKGQIFYGLNESARYLRQESFALIVEGYTDFLTLWQEGFKNLGATLGTALTKFHASLLKRYVNSVVLVFDGDEAGLKASERSLPLLLSEGLEVKFLSLPKGEDPDDFIRSHGKKAFQERLKQAKDLFFFVLQKKYQEFKKMGRENIHLIEEMAPFLAVVQNKALQVLYKQRLLDLFGSDGRIMESLLQERIKALSKTGSTVSRPIQKNEVISAFSLASALEPERLLLVLCLDKEEFLKQFIELKVHSYIKTSGMANLFKKIEEYYGQNPLDFDKLIHLVMNKVSDTNLIFKDSYPIFKGIDFDNQKQIFEDCLNFLKKKEKYSEANELVVEIKMGNKEDIHQLEKVFQLTKQRLRQGDKPKA